MSVFGMCFGLALHAVYLHLFILICLTYTYLFCNIETVFLSKMVISYHLAIFKYLPVLNSYIVNIIIKSIIGTSEILNNI